MMNALAAQNVMRAMPDNVPEELPPSFLGHLQSLLDLPGFDSTHIMSVIQTITQQLGIGPDVAEMLIAQAWKQFVGAFRF